MSNLEVVTAPAHTKLAKLATVKERLRITSSGDDVLLNRLIDEATDEIVRHCKRPFARQRVRESRLDASGDNMFLALTPIVEVHAVTIDGATLLGWDIEDEEAGIVELEASNILSHGGWWNDPFMAQRGASRATVEYTGGYLMPGEATGRNLPYDLEAVCIELVELKYAPDTVDPRIKRESILDSSVEYELNTPALSANVLGKLDRWARVA